MRIRGSIVSRSNEIWSVAVAMSGYLLRPRCGRPSRSEILGAARLPAVPANKSFSVNGLYELEEQGSASIWPLAGTLVPISDATRERRVVPKRKNPLIQEASHHVRREASDPLAICLSRAAKRASLTAPARFSSPASLSLCGGTGARSRRPPRGGRN